MTKFHFKILVLVGSCLTACQREDLLHPSTSPLEVINSELLVEANRIYNAPHGKNFAIIGDTTLQSKTLDVEKNEMDSRTIEILKNGIEDKNAPFRMIVTGGGISAGVRNGGYNNENMMFSFPQLVANQMGIDFRQPYFDEENRNGFGTLLPTNLNPTGGPLPKFKYVTNHLAINYSGTRLTLKPLEKGKRIDNFSLRQFKGYKFIPSSHNAEEPSLNRLLENSDVKSYADRILQEKFDFIIEASNLSIADYSGFNWGIEQSFPNGFENYVDERKNCAGPCHPKYSDKINFLLEIKKRTGVKGVLFTSMPVFELPFTNAIKPAEVRSLLDTYNKGSLLDPDATRLLPSTRLDTLLGTKVDPKLKLYLLSNRSEKIAGIRSTNENFANENHRKEIYSLAKQLNWAVVDLHTIILKIIKGEYVSPDGEKIDKFFAEDGIYPSLVGQAVLANETIKAINTKYGTKIPYVQTSKFINLK